MTTSTKIQEAKQKIEILLSNTFKHIPKTNKNTWDALPHISPMKAIATLCNCIVVLTDVVAAHTYICCGRIGQILGVDEHGMKQLESLWPNSVVKMIGATDFHKLLLLQYEFIKTLLATDTDARPDIQGEAIVSVKGHDACNIPCVAHMYCIDTQMRHILFTLTPAHKGQYLPKAMIYNSSERIDMGKVYEGRSMHNCLSEREKEIVGLAKKGFSSKQIAGRLHISESTVSHHRTKIVKKTGTHNFMEAVNSL